MEVFVKIIDSILVLILIRTGFMYFRTMSTPFPCLCRGFIILSR